MTETKQKTPKKEDKKVYLFQNREQFKYLENYKSTLSPVAQIQVQQQVDKFYSR